MKRVLLMFVIFSFSGLYAQMAADDESGRGISAVSSAETQPEFDPEMVQKIREAREFRSKLHIAQELEGVTPQKARTFRVSNSKSKFSPIKRLMDRLSSTVRKDEITLDRKEVAQQNKTVRMIKNDNSVEK